jgi:hypothetical protein
MLRDLKEDRVKREKKEILVYLAFRVHKELLVNKANKVLLDQKETLLHMRILHKSN